MSEWITREELKEAFDEMARTDIALDDVDYMTDSPKLKSAMAAADHWRELLDRFERQPLPAPPEGV